MVKLMADIASNLLSPSGPKMVRYIAALGGWRRLPKDTLSSELSCPICEGIACFTPIAYPERSNEKVWICAKLNCEAITQVLGSKATDTPTNARRAKEWAVWCQENDIPDLDRECTFQGISQSPADMLKIRNFMSGKKPFLILAGEPGTGKTYTSLGICEKFTQLSASCYFTTQKKMAADWGETFKANGSVNYIPKITNVSLLVIDDFGTGSATPTFLSFFMDLINSRMRWKNRKTIITSNLQPEALSDLCGDALLDRLRTGEMLLFDGPSRRN